MAGTSLNIPAPSVQRQFFRTHVLSFPEYTSNQSAFIPTFPMPLLDEQGIEVPYSPLLEFGVGGVPVSLMENSNGSGTKGAQEIPSQSMIYSPVPTRQPTLLMEARGPDLPVSPHPSIAIGKHFKQYGYC